MAHKVQNLVATNITSSSVELSWDDVTSLTGELYDIERDGVIVETSYTGLTFTDTGLDPDTEYTYRVRAVGGTVAGGTSPTVTPTTVAARASVFIPVVVASAPSVSITPTTVTAVASLATPRIGESDVDPWGIVAARSAITMPVGAVVITAGVDDPQTVINAHSAGTTYWFNGIFAVTTRIVPKSGDTLVTNNAILDGGATWTTGDKYTDGSTFTGCDIGLDPKNGTGTPSDPRTNVTIKGFEIRNFTNNGIRVWLGTEVQYCLVHDCYTNGIGGGFQNIPWAPGGVQTYQTVITDSIVWDTGAIVNLGISGGGMKFARTGDGEDLNTGSSVRSSTANAGVYMTRVYTWRNIGNGLWFDICAGGDVIEDCIADENSRKGFFVQEISAGPATLQDCTSRNNGTWISEAPRTSSDWGVTLVTAKDVTIQRNYIHDNGDNNGIKIDQDGRAATIGHNTTGISVLNNNLRGGDVYFKAAGVTGTVTASGNTDYGAGVYGASYDGTFDPDILEATNVALSTVTTASVVLTPTISAAFSPTNIAGLVAWHDFSDVSTLWQDTARTTAITTDAQVIKGVTDKSGTAHHLSEATNGPAYKTAIRNGLSVSRFDGTNDRLASTVSAAAAQTIFLVLTKNSAPTGAFDGAFSYMDAINAEFTASTALHATNWAYVGDQGGGNPQVGISAAAWHIVTITATTATMSFRSEGGTADATFNPNDVFASGTLFRLGEGPNGFGDIDLAEVVLYDSVLSNANLDLVGNYLAAKWGFTWTGVS